MKKTTLCIWFILILIMTGCGEKKPASDIIVPTEYVFSGENDLWKGDYRVTGFRTFDERILASSKEIMNIPSP